jgi:hypothetical protein
MMTNVRLKRESDVGTKVGTWSWHDNPFSQTRELNGLRVLMAVINNWDLKDVNNAVYRGRLQSSDEEIYEVSDLGASFGSTGLERTRAASKDNLHAFRTSAFIDGVTPTSVNFESPRRAALIILFNPREFFSRLDLRWIGRDIPREDAKWIGEVLAQISPSQLADAFRAGGYRPDEADAFIAVLRTRISQLHTL